MRQVEPPSEGCTSCETGFSVNCSGLPPPGGDFTENEAAPALRAELLAVCARLGHASYNYNDVAKVGHPIVDLWLQNHGLGCADSKRNCVEFAAGGIYSECGSPRDLDPHLAQS
jgi:hypothetical protein